jgi:hypothetical protein
MHLKNLNITHQNLENLKELLLIFRSLLQKLLKIIVYLKIQNTPLVNCHSQVRQPTTPNLRTIQQNQLLFHVVLVVVKADVNASLRPTKQENSKD